MLLCALLLVGCEPPPVIYGTYYGLLCDGTATHGGSAAAWRNRYEVDISRMQYFDESESETRKVGADSATHVVLQSQRVPNGDHIVETVDRYTGEYQQIFHIAGQQGSVRGTCQRVPYDVRRLR